MMKLVSGHKNTYRTIWLKRLIITSVLFGVLIIALPYAIQFGIIKGLSDAGSKTISLDNVNFNPFTGKLSIHHLQTQELQQTQPDLSIASLTLQIDWLPLFKQRLLVTSLTIKDAHIKIEQKDPETLYVGNIKIPLSTPESSENKEQSTTWKFGLKKLHLINNSFVYQSTAFSDHFSINNLTIDEVFSWDPDNSSAFSFNTRLNQSPINGNINVSMFSEQPSINGQLSVKNLDLNSFASLVKNNVDELKGLLDTDIEFSVLLGENNIDYSQTGSLSIRQAAITAASIQYTLGSADWNGSAQLITTPEEPTIKAQGQLVLNELSSTNQLTKLVLGAAQKLTVNNLAIKKTSDITISSVEVERLFIGKKALNNSLLDSKKLLIDKLQVHDLTNIDIKEINVDRLNAALDINKHGDISLLNALINSLPTTEKKQTDDTNSSAKPLQFHVAQLAISKNSQIKFSKETEQERVKKEIMLEHVSIGNINSLTPKSPTPIDIQATIDQFSQLTIKGNIFPLSKKTNATIQTKLSAFELHEFSPIIRDELGYNIQNGQLNADLNIAIKDNILKGETSIEINQLALEAADESKMAKMTQQLSIPLDSALSLLRDDNNDIKLNIPINGDLASPDFNISDVINTAIGNALEGTVKNVLKYALQPYGVIFMAAEKAYGLATAIKLEALVFLPGDGTLPTNSITQLKQIGELMKKRPQLRIRICGFATDHDRVFLQNLANNTDTTSSVEQQEKLIHESLLKLANERQTTIKTYLVSNYHIEATRLFACKPQVENKPDSETATKPRVELMI
ncbi:MAG: hypothetical protein AXW16_00290 [Cycloclasticus sp. Phe_18]|nr:MAG: hypothetical protein AXW16_00290 [Cycloclasticus sp. Phe_18]